jgi:hypothetical protein
VGVIGWVASIRAVSTRFPFCTPKCYVSMWRAESSMRAYAAPPHPYRAWDGERSRVLPPSPCVGLRSPRQACTPTRSMPPRAHSRRSLADWAGQLLLCFGGLSWGFVFAQPHCRQSGGGRPGGKRGRWIESKRLVRVSAPAGPPELQGPPSFMPRPLPLRNAW